MSSRVTVCDVAVVRGGRVVVGVRVLCDPGPDNQTTEGQTVRYHLQARRFAGPLDHPVMNDSKVSTSADLADLKVEARGLRERGYTVWLFREGSASLPGADGRKLIEQLNPLPVTAFSSTD